MGNSFLNSKTAKRFWDYFLNYFLKVTGKVRIFFWRRVQNFIFDLFWGLESLKNKEKQREKANKGSNFSLGRLAAPENIDLWYFSMKIRIIFWTWAILFWTRKPRSGFRVFFWIIFWMPRSGIFFWTRAKSFKKKHWSTRVPRLSLPAAEHSADVFKQ